MWWHYLCSSLEGRRVFVVCIACECVQHCTFKNGTPEWKISNALTQLRLKRFGDLLTTGVKAFQMYRVEYQIWDKCKSIIAGVRRATNCIQLTPTWVGAVERDADICIMSEGVKSDLKLVTGDACWDTSVHVCSPRHPSPSHIAQAQHHVDATWLCVGLCPSWGVRCGYGTAGHDQDSNFSLTMQPLLLLGLDNLIFLLGLTWRCGGECRLLRLCTRRLFPLVLSVWKCKYLIST